MPINHYQQFWHSVVELLCGAAALAFLTWIFLWLQLDIATTVPAYMIVVVLLSLGGSVIPAVTLHHRCSVPRLLFYSTAFQLRDRHSEDIVTVIAFVAASLVITGLVKRARRLGEAAALKDRLQTIIDTIPAMVWSNSPTARPTF